MSLKLEKSINRSQQLDIDRKMIGILSVFAVLGICLVIMIIIATNTLSALRGYASMQTYWTEARKESTFQLINYFETMDSQYLDKFNQSMHSIRSSTAVLQELRKPNSDIDLIRKKLLEIHTMPDDVGIMITTFEWFHDFQDFSDAVRVWNESNSQINEMEELAKNNDGSSISELSSSDDRDPLIQQIINIDQELTEKQYAITASLASGTQFLNTVIIWISSSLGLILLLIGGLLSFKLLKNVKKWHYTIEVSEQKFRSLFEQNPNAVYSLNLDRHFVTGNKALENLTGYSFDKLEGKKIDNVIAPLEIDKVQNHINEAAQGRSITFETNGITKTGEIIHTEITNLPIYVEEEIVGIFGIAHDITERKEA